MAANENGTSQLRKVLAISSALLQDFLQYMRQAQTEYYRIADRIRHGSAGEFGLDIVDHPENYREIHNIDGSVDELKELFDEYGVRYFEIGSNPQAKMASSFIISQEDYVRILNLGLIHEGIENRHTAAGDRDGMQAGPASDDEKIPDVRQGISYKDPLGRTDEEVEHDQNGQDIPEDTGDASLYKKHGDPDKVLADGRGNYFITDENGLQVLCDHDGYCLLADENDPGIFIDSLGNTVRVGDDGNRYLIGEDGTQILIGNDDMPVLAASQNSIYVSPDGVRFIITDEKWMILAGKDGNPLLVVRPDDSIEVDNLGNEIRYDDFNNRFLILDDERQLLVDENDEPILYDGGIGHSPDESLKKTDESLKKEALSPKQDKTEEELAFEHAVYTDAIKREREKKKREQLEYDALLKSENEKSEKLIRGNVLEKASNLEAQKLVDDRENTRTPSDWDIARDQTGIWERRRSEKHLPRAFEKAVETAVTEAAGAGIAESALVKSSLDKPPVQTEAVKAPDSFQDKQAHEKGDAGLKVAKDGLRKQDASTEEKTRRRQVITKRGPEAASGKEPAGSQPSLDADGTTGYKGNPAENNSNTFTERGQQPATAHPQPNIDRSSQNDYNSQNPYSPGTGTGTDFLHADGKSGSVYRNTAGEPLNPDAVSVKEKDFPEETESPQASSSNALVPDGNTGSGRLATRSFHEEAVTGHTGALRSHLKCTEKAINADSVRNDDTELPVSLKRDVRKDADREHERTHKAETNNENVPAASADRFKRQAQEKEYEKQEADNTPDKDLPDKERELQKARAVKNAYMQSQSHQKNGSGARHASDEIFTGHGIDEAEAGYNADSAAEYGSPAYDALKTGGTQKSGAFHMLESSSGQPVAELKQENMEEDRANTSTSAYSGDTVKCGREQHETESSGALRRHIKAGEGKGTAVFTDGTARENSGTLAHHEDNSEDQKSPIPGTREESRAPKVGADAFLKGKDSPANEAEPEKAAHSDEKRRRSEAVRNAYEQSHRISVHEDGAAFHPEDDRSASGSGKDAAGLALDKTKGSPSSVTERADLHQSADEDAQGRFPERPGGKNPGKTDYTDTPDHRPGENDAANSGSRVSAGHSFGAHDITRNGSMSKTNPRTGAGQFLRNDDGENSREDTGTGQLRGETGSRRAGDSVQDAAHKQEETGSSRSEDPKHSKDKVHPEWKNDMRETGRTGHSSSGENDWETGNGQSSGVWMERRKSKNAYAAFQAGIAPEEEPSKTPAIKPSVSDSPDLSEGLSRSRLTEAVKEENKDEKPVNPYLKQDDTAQSTDRKDKNPVPAGTDEKKGRVLRDKRRQAVTAFQRDKRRQENEENRKQENVSLENTRQEEKRNLTFKSRTEALEAARDGMAGTGATIAGYQQQVNAERRELEKAVENEHLAGHGNNQPQDLPDQPYSGQEAGCTTPDGREQQESPEPSKGHMLSEEDKKKERFEKENAKKKANIVEENARQQEYIQRENERQQEFLSQENARQKGHIEQENIRQRELGKKDSGFASAVFPESGINTPGYPADPGRQDGIAGQERSPESEFYGYSGRNTGYEIPAGHQDFSENDTAGRGSTISGYQQEVNAEKLELENAVRDEHLSGRGSSGAPGEYAYEEPPKGVKAEEQEKVNGTGNAPGQASSQDQPFSLNGPEVSNGSQTSGQNSAGYADAQTDCLQAGSSYTDGRLEHEPCKQQETFRNFEAGQNTVIQESEDVLQDITVDPVITVPEEPGRSNQIQDTFYEQTPAERSNETVPVSKDAHNTQNEPSEPLHEREISQNAPVNESAHNYPEGQAVGPVTDWQHPEDSLQNKPQSMYSGHSSEYARQPGNENVIDNTADTFSGKDVTHPAHENAHGGDSYAYPEESAQRSGTQDEKQQHSREFKQGQPFSQDADNTVGHNRYSESHYMNGQGDKGSVAGQANAGSALSGNAENTAGSGSSNITGAQQPQGSQAYNTGQMAGGPGMQGASGGAAPFRFTESPVNRAAGQENAIRNDNSGDTSGSAQGNSFNANGNASRTVYVSPGDPGSPAYSNEAVHSSPKDGLSARMAGNEKPAPEHSIAPDNIRNPYQKNIVQTAQPQDEKAGGPGLAHHESDHRGRPVDTPVKQGVVQSPDAVSPGLNNGNGHTPANANKGISQKGTQASSHATAGTGIVTGIKNAGFHTAGGPVAAMPRTESGSGGNAAPGGSQGTYGGIKKNSHSGVAGSGIKNNSAPAPSAKGDGPRGSAGTPPGPGYVQLPGQKISGQEHTIKDSGLKGGKAQGISVPATDSIKKGTVMPAGTGSGMGKPGSSSQNIPSGNERGQQHAGAARKPAGAASLDNVRAGLLKSRNMAGAFGPPGQNDKGRAPKGSGIKNRAPRIKSWKESELSSGTLRSHVNAIRQNGGKGAAYNVESSSFQKNGSGKDAKKTSNLTRALLRALDYKDSMGNNELRQGARRSAEAGEMLYLLTFAVGRFQKKAIEADKKELARILTADDRKVLEGIALDAGIKRNGNMGPFCLEKESGRENFSTVMAKAKVMRRDGDVFTRIGAKDMYDRGGLVQRGIGRIKNRGKKVTYHNTKEYSLAYLKQIARKQGIELSDAQASEMYSRFLKAGKTNEHLRQTIRGGKRAWKNMLGWHFNPIDNKMIRAQINGTDKATQQGLYAMKRSTSVTKTTLQLFSTARANLLAKKTRKLTKKYEKLKAYRGGRPNDIKSGLKYSHLTEDQLEKKLKKSLDKARKAQKKAEKWDRISEITRDPFKKQRLFRERLENKGRE